MNKNAKIFIAGHQGLVGSAIVKELKIEGYTNLILRTRKELNLLNTIDVAGFFKKEKPEYVVLAAAKVGGILANNKYRADFIYENLAIQNNVIHQSYLYSVKKLLFLGSTCIYPKNAPQPLKESYLLTGELEYTNEPYAIAKIAGIKMCESYNLQYHTNFISVMPTNLYGPNDNFDLEKSHVLPALIRKIHLGRLLESENWNAIRKDLKKRPIQNISDLDEKEITIDKLANFGILKTKKNIIIKLWGSGRPMREFMWSEDMARACVFIMKKINFSDCIEKNTTEIKNTHINIGTGEDISIKDLSILIKDIVGFKGQLLFDTTKPDGVLKKLTDVTKLQRMGWQHHINLKEGVIKMYKWYLEQ